MEKNWINTGGIDLDGKIMTIDQYFMLVHLCVIYFLIAATGLISTVSERQIT